MIRPPDPPDDFDRGIDALTDAVFESYGYDFRQYARASKRRRIQSFLEKSHTDSLADITEQICSDATLLARFLDHMSVPTTRLFRNPNFYQAFQRHVVPTLSSYAAFKLWHAGCATGEEVYSMAILLQEHGLLDRATIYATDMSPAAIEHAKSGIVRSQFLKRDSANYFASGMRHSLNDYWHTRHGYSILDTQLLRRVVFSEHNLATDSSFGEMNAIVCRNVLIYFDRSLQDRVLRLFLDSLAYKGFLGLGSKESIGLSKVAAEVDVISRKNRIYRRKFGLSS